ncbi:Acetolactate synthase isozyme 1 large subunit [Clavibacter michiganensis]|nr:Acetolactate synthase isozyme 1 large subunit [Clavibacter michiganensis]
MSEPEPGAWEIVARTVEASGVPLVVGLPGDDMAALAAFAGTSVRTLWARDQRHAVNVASGAALASGRPTVAVVGRGPGAAAAVPAMLEASSGSSGVLLISGGVPLGREESGAFQDAPQLALLRPVLRRAVRVTSADQLAGEVVRCLAVSGSRTPGPTYIEVPDDLPVADVATCLARVTGAVVPARDSPNVPELLLRAERPVILVGGGMARSESARITRLAERLSAAIFCTASGRGVVDESHELFCGLSGLYARGTARRLLADADVLLALGSRLEETALDGLDPALPVIQVNTEAEDLATRLPGLAIVGDADEVLRSWGARLCSSGADGADTSADRLRRRAEVVASRAAEEAWAASLSDTPPHESGTVPIARLLSALSDALPDGCVLVHENGLADIWSYAHPVLRLPEGALDICPSEQTTLGFGVSAAVGASLAWPDRLVVAIVGDGAMDVAQIDAELLAAPGARVLWIVLDNGGYGWLHEMAGSAGDAFASPARRGSGLRHPRGPAETRADPDRDIADTIADALASLQHGSRVLTVPVSLADLPPAVTDPPPHPPARQEVRS